MTCVFNGMSRWRNPITRSQLVPFVEKGCKQEDIAVALGKHNSTICLALKKFGLAIPAHRSVKNSPVCTKCGCTDQSKFRKRPGVAQTERWCSWCVDCTSSNVNLYKQKNRARLIEFLGGKCAVCGFSKYQSALDAHHIDPSIKDVSADSMLSWSWKRLEAELRECVLLCSNCHRGHHNEELSADDEAKIKERAASS